MSIASEISRLSSNISDSLDAVAAKGVTVPSDSNSDDLPGLIALIEQSSGGDSGGTIYQDTDGYLHLSEDNKNVISIVDTLDTAGGTIRTIDAKVESSTEPILISSGTFIGSNNAGDGGRQEFSIGQRMASTDFYVKITAKDNIPYQAYYQFAYLFAVCHSFIGYFDLSTDGTGKSMIAASRNFAIDNDGTITQTPMKSDLLKMSMLINNAATTTHVFNQFRITKASSGFSIYIGQSNPSYLFPPIEYEYEVVYFGSNPSSDIVSI